MEEQDQDSGLSRGKQLVAVLSTLVFFAFFFGSIVAFLAEPDVSFSVRDRVSHSRIPLTREQGLAIFVPLLVMIAAIIAVTYWRGLRQVWKTAQPGAIAPELHPGETVLWFGRIGWRSFRGLRVLGVAFVIVIPLLLLWWMWSIASGDDRLSIKLFFLSFPAAGMFCYFVPAILYSSDGLKIWLWEALGSIAITRQRIVWLTPMKRQIYRTISAAEIVDACVTDLDGRRGSLVIIKRLTNDVETICLDGTPDPEKALAAVQALITYRSPSYVRP